MQCKWDLHFSWKAQRYWPHWQVHVAGPEEVRVRELNGIRMHNVNPYNSVTEKNKTELFRTYLPLDFVFPIFIRLANFLISFLLLYTLFPFITSRFHYPFFPPSIQNSLCSLIITVSTLILYTYIVVYKYEIQLSYFIYSMYMRKKQVFFWAGLLFLRSHFVGLFPKEKDIVYKI